MPLTFNLIETDRHTFLTWKGDYTYGECSIRGTTAHFTEKAANAYCETCRKTFPCNDKTIMRTESVSALAEELTEGTEEIGYRDVAFWDGSVCCKRGSGCILVQFIDKNATLQELAQVLNYVNEHGVFQEWI